MPAGCIHTSQMVTQTAAQESTTRCEAPQGGSADLTGFCQRSIALVLPQQPLRALAEAALVRVGNEGAQILCNGAAGVQRAVDLGTHVRLSLAALPCAL